MLIHPDHALEQMANSIGRAAALSYITSGQLRADICCLSVPFPFAIDVHIGLVWPSVDIFDDDLNRVNSAGAPAEFFCQKVLN